MQQSLRQSEVAIQLRKAFAPMLRSNSEGPGPSLWCAAGLKVLAGKSSRSVWFMCGRCEYAYVLMFHIRILPDGGQAPDQDLGQTFLPCQCECEEKSHQKPVSGEEDS
ncbi:MAG: hypothetical protein KGI67_05680 [Pseudomonadota bacterium]|nr:hypothetical protein [Pseudomonadota bacterium]